MKVEFSSATPVDSDLLSDIAIESKGHWGYPRETLELWRKDLRIAPAYIDAHTVRIIRVDAEAAGFFAIKNEEEPILDHLWLLPRFIGKGIGALAFKEILRECRQLGIREFVIVSDPDAEGFYLRQGAVRIGEVESIPQNRMLPKLVFRL